MNDAHLEPAGGCSSIDQRLLQALLLGTILPLTALQPALLRLQRLCELQQVLHRLGAAQPRLQAATAPSRHRWQLSAIVWKPLFLRNMCSYQ